MHTLACRPGDPQALKAAAAASATNTAIEIAVLSSGSWAKLVTNDSAAPAALKDLFLILPNGSTIAEPNAIARYLGTSHLISPSQHLSSPL